MGAPTKKKKIQSKFFTSVPWAAAKSESDDSEEETKSTKSKKKATASSASMFQTSGDKEKDKDKKTKKKGRFTSNLSSILFFWRETLKSFLQLLFVCFSKGRREWWFWVRKRRKIKEEKGQREEEKGKSNLTAHLQKIRAFEPKFNFSTR